MRIAKRKGSWLHLGKEVRLEMRAVRIAEMMAKLKTKMLTEKRELTRVATKLSRQAEDVVNTLAANRGEATKKSVGRQR